MWPWPPSAVTRHMICEAVTALNSLSLQPPICRSLILVPLPVVARCWLGHISWLQRRSADQASGVLATVDRISLAPRGAGAVCIQRDNIPQ